MSIYRQKAFETQSKRRKLPPKFKVNDLVRIQKLKNKFSRGYEKKRAFYYFKNFIPPSHTDVHSF